MDKPQSFPIGGQWHVTYVPLTPGFHNRSLQNQCKLECQIGNKANQPAPT